MTSDAERFTVRDFISQFWVMFPCQDVVGVKFLGRPALLAGIRVAAQNSATPRSVSPTSAFVARCFSKYLSGRLVFAVPTAIHEFVAVCRHKGLVAKLASNNRSRVQGLRAFIRASYSSLVLRVSPKYFAADNALYAFALIAVILPRVRNAEGFTAPSARAFDGVIGWLRDYIDSLPVNAIPACLPIRPDWFSAFWTRLLFVWHGCNYTIFCDVERLAQMGLEPVLVE